MPGNIYVYTSQHVNIIFFLLTFRRLVCFCSFFPTGFCVARCLSHSSCLEDNYEMLGLKMCSYRAGSEPWWQVRGWEPCPVKHSSRLSLIPASAAGGRGERQQWGTEDTACPPGLLPRRALCLPGAWMWNVTETLPKLVQPLDCHPVLFFLIGPNDTLREDVEHILSVNA